MVGEFTTMEFPTQHDSFRSWATQASWPSSR